MVSIEHPMTSHRNQKERNVVPQEMHEAVVMSPEDEEFVRRHMEELEAQAKEVEREEDRLLDDPVIAAEIEKKRVLEKLVLFKRPHTKKVKIADIVFTLKILDPNENDAVYAEVLKFKPQEQLAKTSLMLLAASLIEADGVPIESTYSGPAEVENPMLQRYYELCKYPSPLVNQLIQAYQAFSSQVESQYSFDFLEE